jgi:predicted aconitase with swiveling domain
MTNRESGLSALASALTGYTPNYGLMGRDARKPNLEVHVKCDLEDPADFSILGDWIGKQRRANWRMPHGPIPLIFGLPEELNHEQRKALTAAAANYGSPMVYIDGISDVPEVYSFQDSLEFSSNDLTQRYEELKPRKEVSLVIIGCPQASIGEIREVARLLKGRTVTKSPEEDPKLPPLWIFTSSANKAIAERTGLAKIITGSGALLLENTCPEVVPYDGRWVKHMLTNSMKAEHYLQSGLNNIPTSVMALADCIDVATGELRIKSAELEKSQIDDKQQVDREIEKASKALEEEVDTYQDGAELAKPYETHGRGLPSQGDFSLVGEAFITDVPITFLGFVDRLTGTISEPGHPVDGRSMAGKIAIFPKGTGSTVAPYVLLELFYRGVAPMAIVNTDIDQQTAPACSIENIPYAFGISPEVFDKVRDGDQIELTRRNNRVILRSL